jgi:hypothetical protein
VETLDCARVGEVAGASLVAGGDPGACAAAWVGRDGVGRLAGGEVDCDRDDGFGRDGEVEGVGDCVLL